MRIVTTGRTGLWDAVCVAGAVVVLTVANAAPARAQAFADLPKALVNYAQADLSPKKACDTLSRFRSKEIEKIQEWQHKIIKEMGKPKMEFNVPITTSEMEDAFNELVGAKLEASGGKLAKRSAVDPFSSNRFAPKDDCGS